MQSGITQQDIINASRARLHRQHVRQYQWHCAKKWLWDRGIPMLILIFGLYILLIEGMKAAGIL